jgi:hypothetical protein
MPTRAPIRPTIQSTTLRPRLARMENSFVARWTALVLLGAAFCLIGPVIVGSFIWLHQFQERGAIVHSWLNRVAVTGVIFLPILFLIEWATRGKLLEEGAEALGAGARLPVGRQAAQGMVFLELCLWGPRMVIAGTKKLFNLSKHRSADRNLAAEMLAMLVNAGQGIPTAQLYPLAKNNDDAFSDALAYLLFHDLIGISKTGERAWLLSEAKRTLGMS